MLVHYGIVAVDIGIGMGDFRNLSERRGLCQLGKVVAGSTFRRVPARGDDTVVVRELVLGDGGWIDIAFTACGMILGRDVDNAGVTAGRIIGMGDIGTAIGSCTASNEYRSAGLC